MTGMKLNIAAVQMKCRVGDVAWNLDRSMELIRQACKRKVDLICFPESVLDGYACGKPGLSDYARPIDGPEVRQIGALAKKHAVAIMWSLAERYRGKVANTAILLGKNGKTRMIYRKVHLCKKVNEHRSYVAGKEFSVASIGRFKVGAMICFDRHFPESARTLRLLGANLILHPTATGAFSPDPASLNTAMMRTRAYENSCFILSVNRADHKGGSALFGPWGEVLAIAGKKEEILFCDVDLNSIKEKPARFFDLMGARMPRAYRSRAGKSGSM